MASALARKRPLFGLLERSSKAERHYSLVFVNCNGQPVPPVLEHNDFLKPTLRRGWRAVGIPSRGRAPVPGSKPHPPLPIAVLGPIRLFDTQPQFPSKRGGSATRACRPRGFAPIWKNWAERTRVIADPVRHFGRLSRGGWSSAPKRQEPTPCPGKMPPPLPPASPPR